MGMRGSRVITMGKERERETREAESGVRSRSVISGSGKRASSSERERGTSRSSALPLLHPTLPSHPAIGYGFIRASHSLSHLVFLSLLPLSLTRSPDLFLLSSSLSPCFPCSATASAISLRSAYLLARLPSRRRRRFDRGRRRPSGGDRWA